MNNVLQTRPVDFNLSKLAGSMMSHRNKVFGLLIIAALLAFEIFNYSTTEFALNDVLGNLTFMGMHWATILSIAFCGIDFAGIARLFTPEHGSDEPMEVWYLFGAWVCAAAMNATLTWWGVSVAIANHTSAGTAVVSSSTIQTVVPIFVAVMVWVIRILIIGTFSLAGERILGQTDSPVRRPVQHVPQQTQTIVRNPGYTPQRTIAAAPQNAAARPMLAPASSFKPQPKPVMQQRTENTYARPAEPTYHNLASNSQVEQFEAKR